jgi:hypothetical protein
MVSKSDGSNKCPLVEIWGNKEQMKIVGNKQTIGRKRDDKFIQPGFRHTLLN